MSIDFLIPVLAETIDSLGKFEKGVAKLEQARKDAVLLATASDPKAAYRGTVELENLIKGRLALREKLAALDLALKNSAATFERFDQKAAKDSQTVKDAKARLGAPTFDDSDPILVQQRAAMERTAQKLGFFTDEITKVAQMLDNKYGAERSSPELQALKKALEENLRDADSLFGKGVFEQDKQALLNLAKQHHLD